MKYNSELLADPYRWVTPPRFLRDFRMVEPLSGEILDTSDVPKWLQAEPDFAQGLANWEKLRERLAVDVIFSMHTAATDLGKDIYPNGRFESRLKKADFFGYEGILSSKAAENKWSSNISSAFAITMDQKFDHFHNILNSFGYESSFVARLGYAAVLGNVTSFSYDLRADGSETEIAIAKAMSKLGERTEDAAALMALQNAREWCAVANSGLKLVEADSSILKGNSRINYAMTIGSNHGDILRKIDMRQPQALTTITFPVAGTEKYIARRTRASVTGRIENSFARQNIVLAGEIGRIAARAVQQELG